MSRIAKIDAADWDPELRAMFRADEATPLEQGTMRMFAHRPAIAKGLIALGAGIKADRTLPERLIELVRLRIAFHNQCRSCMAIRYRDAQEDGVDETLVCSLEKPMEAPDLTDAEKVALRYADRFATDHLSIGDALFADLRRHFDEGQIVELASWVAFCVGFGRLGAVMDMTEELPEAFQDKTAPVTPWRNEAVVVR
ncbi:carboxymuconolactone decarboxylase family protein [Sphingomonas profundi]|uniref:carboxymuconolactone decarboxylase family protein n=1 Tax=Alterirhizorhabdus profundi TaxID=2681549 RepID=UPI0012E75F71|nr:carboxymuconolactone decarboxylase family protein [Sphingomonas profundi]